MRLRKPLHPGRLLPLATLSAFLLLSLPSCMSPKEIRASIDGSNEHEGGPSKIQNAEDYGLNVAMCTFLSMPRSHSNASADDALPSSGWVLGPQVEFVQKGSKLDARKTSLTYFNAIGDVLYQYPMEGKGTLYGGLGPYIGYGLAGHVKGSGFKEPAFGSDGFKRFDAGLHLTAGYRLPVGLSVNLVYEFGLINKSRFDDFTSRNRTVSLQIGYSLDKIIDGLRKK